MKLLFSIFLSFFKIGSCLFGGGYAMLPLIEREVINKQNWITTDELLEITSIAQMTPGAIATNSATYIGTKLAGRTGAFIATIGVILPSFLIIGFVYCFLADHFDAPIVKAAFSGIRACILGLILVSVKRLFKAGIKNNTGFFIFIFSIIVLLFLKIHPILLILGVGITSLLMSIIKPNLMKKML